MLDLLYDAPWWLLLLLLVAGVALWWSGNNRRDKTLMRVGLGVALLGVIVGVISWFVDSDVESVSKRTRQIVQSVDQRDWEKMRSLLDQRTSLVGFRNRDEIVAGAKTAADAVGLKHVRVFRMEATKKDTVIQVNFNVISEQERVGSGASFTNWQFDWQNFGTGWRLDRITPLGNDTVSAEQVRSALQRYR